MRHPSQFGGMVQQPPVVEIKLCPGLFVKQMLIEKADTYIPQHSHAYPHLTMLAVGSVFVWKDGEPMGRFDAPAGIYIEAGCKHTFGALVDHTLLYCIHAVGPDGEPSILEEHNFGGRL